MPGQDQLEVILPEGALEFHTLDEAAGITNIGRNPSNDIVLGGRSIADFHIVLDHREKPCRVMALSDTSAPTLSGQSMVPQQYYDFHAWESIEVGGYSLILLEDQAVVAPVVAPPPQQETPAPVVASVALAAAGAAAGAAVVAPRVTTGSADNQPFPDIDSESIVVEISQRELVVDVDQRAAWQLTVINGGPIVASFQVHVEGWIDASWVSIVPDRVNLFEGERTTFTVTVTPPRQPTSRAGVHYLAIVVSSPNYAAERSQRAITLVINPYHDFKVGELTPRQQNISYFRHAADYELAVRNDGNSDVTFQVQGSDDQLGTAFEFKVPGEEISLARQAEFQLGPAQEAVIPIAVTPNRRRVVGARKHDYSLTVTTTIPETQLAPRSVLGMLGKRPLIGPWVITATLILMAILAVIIFRPRIESFDFASGTVMSATPEEQAEGALDSSGSLAEQAGDLPGATLFGFKLPKLPKAPKQLKSFISFLTGSDATSADGETGDGGVTLPSGAMVNAGQEVTLVWDTAWATTLVIEKELPGATVFIASIENPITQREFTFTADQRERAVYVLKASNMIERIPIIGTTLGREESRVGLIVDPVRPELLFEVNPAAVIAGEAVDIAWEVDQADEYDLVINGAPRPLAEARGSMQDMPQIPTEYQLVARSIYWEGPVVETRQVLVALPTPFIREFSVSPNPIVEGEVVAVTWQVDGADAVTINPIPGQVPNPEEGRDEGMVEAGQSEETFILVASVGEGERAVEARATRVLPVVPPTPTITPTPTPTNTPTPTETTIAAPIVRSFDVQPKPVIEGELAKMNWAVEGATSVEILPLPGSVPNLEGEDEINVEPGKSQETFTLIAVNTDGVNRRELRVTRIVNIVTPTPTTTLTPTPSPTITPQPPKILQFQIAPTQIVRGQRETDQNGNATDQSLRPNLSWTVSGDTTNIEIVGNPDFGPVTNLAKDGKLSVLPIESTTYQLNAYLGEDVIDSRTVALEVLEPTPTVTPTAVPPTAVPTPTSTPLPAIASFSVAGVDGSVSPIGSSDNTPTYELEAGTQVRFSWRVTNPGDNEVTLTDSFNNVFGGLLPEGELQLVIIQSSLYILSVPAVANVQSSIRLEVLPIVPPPPPNNVTGQDGADESTPSIVKWSYPGDAQDKIVGFRVYRSVLNDFTFVRVADESTLPNTERQWQDPVTPSCNWAFYVVAVYNDIVANVILETAASPTSWQTKPCATP